MRLCKEVRELYIGCSVCVCTRTRVHVHVFIYIRVCRYATLLPRSKLLRRTQVPKGIHLNYNAQQKVRTALYNL